MFESLKGKQDGQVSEGINIPFRAIFTGAFPGPGIKQQPASGKGAYVLILMNPERPKLYEVLAVLCAIEII